MHAVVMESLEEYLSGTLGPAGQRDIEAHLLTCRTCREELESMRDVSLYLGSLRSEETWEPSGSFYAGVMERVTQNAPAPALASFFALDFVFGRRLVFASLLTLAVLGSYLVSRETNAPRSYSAAAVLAQQNFPAFDSAPAQDNMLVTLTTYEH